MIKITLTETSGLSVNGLDLYTAGVTSLIGEVNSKTTGNSRYSSCLWYNTKADGTVDKDSPIKPDEINLGHGMDYLAKTEDVDTYDEDRGGLTGVDGDIYNYCSIHINLLELKVPSLSGQITILQ